MMRMHGVDSVSESFDDVANLPSARKEGLTDRFRQRISAVGKRTHENDRSQVSERDLSNLTARSQVRYSRSLR